jgi:methylated-DNA-[protein]-cysteine S-methyltransferase
MAMNNFAEKLIASSPAITLEYDGESVKLLSSSKQAFIYRYPKGQYDEAVAAWLLSYAKRKPLPAPPFKLDTTPFRRKVLEALKKIPFGKTATYQDIAHKIGNSRAVRAVGSGCATNPYALFIPCHRVLRTDGGLGGFAGGLEIKKILLAFESDSQ